MKKLSFLLISGLIIISLATCSNDDDKAKEKYPKVEIKLTAEQSSINLDGQNFAWKLLDKIYEEEAEKGKNILVSPFSLNYALAMLQNGANGETLDEILAATELNKYQLNDINNFYKHLSDGLIEADKSVIFNNANSIWYRNDFLVLDQFITTNKKYYDAEVKKEDFKDPKTKDRINQWCSDKTNGKIDKIIEKINDDVVMYLINAIYFKAYWENQFSKDDTKDDIFTLADKSTISTPFMHNKVEAPYLENDLFSYSALNFGNGAYQMFFILPKKEVKTRDLIVYLKTNWISLKPSTMDVEFAVPKFETAFETELIPTLQSLGMHKVFKEGADLSKLSSIKELFVSSVKQKTYIKIDEEGGEAAAVTSVEVKVTSPGNIAIFRLDRPFLYGIRETSTGCLLFTGHMANPTQKQ